MAVFAAPARITPPAERTRLEASVRADRPSEGLWFHGTLSEFTSFRLDLGDASRRTADWNALLGVHFGREPELIREHFSVDYHAPLSAPSTGRLIAAKLAIESPARFPSEFELDRLALELLLADGLHPRELEPAWVEPGSGEQARLRRWLERKAELDPDRDGWFRDVLLRHYRRCAELVRAELERRGHDGIVYGNEFEGACVCAIAFTLEQIEIVDADA